MKPEIRVEGLTALRKALKTVDVELEKEFREELKNSSVMSALVMDARARLTATIGKNLKRPARSTGRAAGSIRVTSDSRAVYIHGGKKAVPYYGWLDFGGVLKPSGRRKNTQRRPILRQGRGLYPAISAHRAAIGKVALDAAENLQRKAGLK